MAVGSRNWRGFTLIELLVVVIIIGILAAIALPNYIGAQNKAKLAGIRSNMHTTHICAESYATDASGEYPPAASDLDPYFPGGGNCLTGAPGVRPQNPLTGVANDALYAAGLSTTTAILTQRTKAPIASGGSPGQTGYSQADTGTSYGITGADSASRMVGGPNGGTLVLSNH